MPFPDRAETRERPWHGPTLGTTVWSLVTVLVGLVLVSALVTGLARLGVAQEVRQLADRLLPAQQATRTLVTASLDQETGQRGFLLLGDPAFLEPYVAGQRAEAAATASLTDLLGSDPSAMAELTAASAAVATWRAEVAEPDIAARRAGVVPAEQVETSERRGKQLFDSLRRHLGALEDRSAIEVRGALDRVFAAQQAANAVAWTSVVLAAAVAAVSVPLVRRRMIGPLVALRTQAERTAAGEYETPIAVAGPRDLAAISEAVETMRSSVLAHGAELTDARLELALRDARDRLAAEVHDNSVQRLFALGLALQATGRRHPEVEDALGPLVDETDDIVRELRELIAGLVRTEVSAVTLRDQVFDLVRDSGRVLGITPALEIQGSLEDALTDEVAQELLAVLRESLGNVARHARAPSAAVRLAADDAQVALTVEDDGVGVPADLEPGGGLTAVARRAERLGATLSVTPRPGGGTRVSWQIPRARTGVPATSGTA